MSVSYNAAILNMRPGTHSNVVVHISQYDVGDSVNFDLYLDDSPYPIPSGATITAHGTKGNGLGYTVPCTYSGNRVTFIVTKDISSFYGFTPSEIVIKDANGNNHGTANFMIMTEHTPHEEGTLDGSSDAIASQMQIWYESTESNAKIAKDSADSAYHNAIDAKHYRDSAAEIVTPDGLAALVNANTDRLHTLYFDTVADLKACTTCKEGDYCKTAGYYAVNDGGGALYRIVREKNATDYYEDLNKSNLYAMLIVKDYVTPKMMGAYGNGENDDTDVLNKFFSYKTSYPKKIPSGKYLITNTVYIRGIWENEKESNNEYLIDFSGSSLLYDGVADGCCLYIYNHNKSSVNGIVLEKESKRCYINLCGVWKSNFNNFEILCDCTIKFNGDTSKEDVATKAIQNININDIATNNVNIEFNSQDTYINEIIFNNCQFYGNNAKEYFVTLNDSQKNTYNNISFNACDISYYTKALIYSTNGNRNLSKFNFDKCYFDSSTPILYKDYGLKLTVSQSFFSSGGDNIGDSIAKYGNLNFFGNNGRIPNITLHGGNNLVYNGNFEYVGESPTHNTFSQADAIGKSFVSTIRNETGNALKLDVPDGKTTIYYNGAKYYSNSKVCTFLIRGVKISGSGKLQAGMGGLYRTINLDNVENGNEFIMTYVNNNEFDYGYSIGRNVGGSLSFLDATGLSLEIDEISIIPGNNVVFNAQLAPNASVTPYVSPIDGLTIINNKSTGSNELTFQLPRGLNQYASFLFVGTRTKDTTHLLLLTFDTINGGDVTVAKVAPVTTENISATYDVTTRILKVSTELIWYGGAYIIGH